MSHRNLEEGVDTVHSQEGTAGDRRKKKEKKTFSYTDQRMSGFSTIYVRFPCGCLTVVSGVP